MKEEQNLLLLYSFEKYNKVPGKATAIFDCVSGSGSYLIINQEVFSNIKIEKQQYKYRPLKKFMI